MRLSRELPVGERRKAEDSEYIFEHRTEQSSAARFTKAGMVPLSVGCDGSRTRYRARVSPEDACAVFISSETAGTAGQSCFPRT